MTIKVGRLGLTEGLRAAAEKVDARNGDRSISLQGQESAPPLSQVELVQRHSDLMALTDSVVPVTFVDKADRNGFYRVTDSGSDLTNWQGEGVVADWGLNLLRVGTEHEIDFESRLSGPVSRQNDFAVVGERVHAPAVGHYGYSAGTTIPTTMTRTGSDGAITVYRGLAVNTHPRWASPVATYLSGRVRFIDGNGLERSGVDVPLAPTGWELHNSLVRVRPVGGLLEVSAWSGGAWRAKTWGIRVSNSPVGDPVSATLLRNEPEMIVLRLMWLRPGGPGRVTADLTLRRGHRFVETWIENQTSATIRVQRGETEAAVASTGYITATANDATGNRYWIASLKTVEQELVNGSLALASSTTLGVAIGAVVGGGTAVSGDTGADLFKQYVGAPSERVEGVRR